MGKKRIVVALAALGLAVTALWPMRCLTVRTDDGTLKYACLVTSGEKFTVRFTHSVARRPVDETYTVENDNTIRVTETVFDMGGAGLPSAAEPGQTFTIENGKYRITGFSARLKVLTYRVSRVVADHRFIIGDTEIPLRAWAQRGRAVSFRVERQPCAWIIGWMVLTRLVPPKSLPYRTDEKAHPWEKVDA